MSSDILYFEYLLVALDLMDKKRRLNLAQAEIGYSAGDNLDWMEDFAWEEAQRNFNLVGKSVTDAERRFYEYKEIIPPTRKQTQNAQIGATVVLDLDGTKDQYLLARTSEIPETNIGPYAGRISIEAELGQKMDKKPVGYVFKKGPLIYTIVAVEWGVKDYLSFYLPEYFAESRSMFDRLKGRKLKVGEISTEILTLAKIIDRCRFINLAGSSYGNELAILQETGRYIDRIRDLLQRAKFSYKTFDEALNLIYFKAF